MSRLAEIKRRLRTLGDPDRAATSRRYFKTATGEYGEGDRFLGIPVPVLRKLARELKEVGVSEALTLLRSPVHEERFLALVLLSERYRRGAHATREAIFTAYLDSTEFVNNWDLVDTSAPHIVGAHLVSRDRAVLDRLACSESLWERRIAILATFFIRQGEFSDTLRLAESLLHDSHDLIHKAVGWMLREVGNRDRNLLLAFLDRNAASMPSVMLRYATEKLPKAVRTRYRGRPV